MGLKMKKPNNEIPKDLGLKIGSKDEVFWTKVRDAAKQALDIAEDTVKLQSAVMIMADKHIKGEQRKAKV